MCGLGDIYDDIYDDEVFVPRPLRCMPTIFTLMLMNLLNRRCCDGECCVTFIIRINQVCVHLKC